MTEGLPSPHPLGQMLPGIYLEDRFAQKFTGGLDDVISSLLCTLDNLEAYFDPDLAPEDFVDWLAGWVGLVPDPTARIADRRRMIREMVEIYRWRGTGHGLRDHIVLAFGLDTEIDETGGVWHSTQPRSPLPGRARPEMIVRIRVEDPASFDAELLDRFIQANKPAHIPHRIEVLPLGGTPAPPPAPPPPSEPRRPASGDGGPDPEAWVRKWRPPSQTGQPGGLGGRIPRPRGLETGGSGPPRAGDE